MEKNIPKYTQVYNDLVTKIQNGTYRPGDRIPTELELAEFYGVSRVTVGRALKQMTEAGLIRRVKKSGTFVGNTSIKDKPPLLVAVILPFDENLHTNFWEGAQGVALRNNVFLSFFMYGNNIKVERETLSSLLKMRLDGLIIYPCFSFQNIDLLTRLQIKGVKIVFFDRRVDGIDAPCITTDNVRAVIDATNHLLESGHKRIGFYGLSKHMVTTEHDRFSGYVQALVARGIPVNSEYLFSLEGVHYNYKEYYQHPKKHQEQLTASAQRMLEQCLSLGEKPDAFICTTDVLAINFLDMAIAAGMSVPEDFSIVGFDDLPAARAYTVPLTTMSQDFYTLGQTVVEIVLGLIHNKKYHPQILIPATLVIRDSTKARSD